MTDFQVQIGDDVIFTMPDGKTERPAKVVQVWPADTGVNLCVFVDGSNDGEQLPVRWETGVKLCFEPQPRTFRYHAMANARNEELPT